MSRIPEQDIVESVRRVLEDEDGDYRGVHEAPDPENGAPGNDVTANGIYPDDIYGPNGAQYYGHYGSNNRMDVQSVSVIRAMRGKPNKSVTIYRAVPHSKTPSERIAEIERQKAYVLKHGRIPPNVAGEWRNSSAFYDDISVEMDELRDMPDPEEQPSVINSGDWVTINRAYAKEHGESALRGNFCIVKKTVKAHEIFTDGNSIHEWGYWP